MAIGTEVVPDVEPIEGGTTPGTAHQADPRPHGEEDPEREVTVEEREAARHAFARQRNRGGFGHEL